MTALRNGLLLAALQIALVLSLGAKLLYDRSTRPRVWVFTQVYDPDLPIRGRYLSERLLMHAEGFTYKVAENTGMEWYQNRQGASLEVRNGQLIARPDSLGQGESISLHKNSDGTLVAMSEEPVLLFISDRAQVPSLKPGEEMWVEVTVPKKGPPRPIRVAIKKDGTFTPLNLD